MERASPVPVEILEPFLEILKTNVWIPYQTNDSFRLGFCWGSGLVAFLLLIIGGTSRFILYFLAPVISFFKPSRKPAMDSGPSPFGQMMGCFSGVLKLIIVSVIILALLFLYTRSLQF